MFWGIKLEANRDYTQTVVKPFQLTSAILEVNNNENNIITVNLKYEDEKFLICNLSQKHGILQVPLNLEFDDGEEITFSTSGGESTVYLSGYINQPQFLDDEDEIEDEVDEEEIEECIEKSVAKGMKLVQGDDDEDEEEEEAPKLIPAATKKRKAEQEVEPSKKKSKLTQKQDKQSEVKNLKKISPTSLKDLIDADELEEDSDDEDFVDKNTNEADEDEEDDDDDQQEEEEEEEDDDDDEDEGDDEDDEDDDDENVEGEEEEEEDEDKVEEEEEIFDSKGKKSKSKKGKVELTNGTVEKKNNKENKSPNKKGPKIIETDSKKSKLEKKNLSGGIVVQDLKEGTGKVAHTGKMVQVYYEGRLKSNGKLFDKCLTGNPFKFRLGKGEVISGWDIGVAGMKVGQKRRITCPPAVAYGKKGCPPQIPPNSTLMFDVELKGVM